MNRYRNPALRQLAEQQMRYSPRDVRLAQIARTEAIVPSLDLETQYRYVDLCERITSFRTDRYPDLIITGDEALHDLRCFVEDLSHSVGQSPEQAGEPILSLAEVCKRFNVSEKTVQRWRSRGLVSRWFLHGKRFRLGFLESSVTRFAESRPDEVQRGSSFRPVADDEKLRIVRRARRLARHGATLAEISRRLARKFRRSPETIRYTIRWHDGEFPAAAVFSDWRGRISDDDRREIYRSARRGVPPARLAKQYGCTKSSVYRLISEERARRLTDQTIEFIDSDEFHHEDAATVILAPDTEPDLQAEPTAPPPELPPYLAALYNIPVLSREEEAHCFRKLNFLKYQAAELQSRIDVRKPLARLMDQMEESLRLSHEVKNYLIRSNLRLVVSVARRHLKPGGNFFEMVSDGNMALINAIERFDYRRGNKFSTYGTWMVMKSFARAAPAEATLSQRFQSGSNLAIQQASAPGNRSNAAADNPRKQQALMSILNQLDSRERAIIMYRFGIGVTGEPETLDQVGKRLGVTKERIRQLEQRALQKLRQLALDEKLELPENAG